MSSLLRHVMAAAILLAAPVGPLLAAPIPYVIEFTVLGVNLGTYCPERIPTDAQRFQFDCSTAAGDRYVASFTLLDDEILATDGQKPAPMAHFFAVVGGIVWSQDFPHPLSAYLQEITGIINGEHVSGGPLGVEVVDGEIVGFVEGAMIRGPSPIMFLGFTSRHTFFSDSIDFGTMRGEYLIRRVSEPQWIVLALLTLLAVSRAGNKNGRE